jgi:hypothetical protein
MIVGMAWSLGCLGGWVYAAKGQWRQALELLIVVVYALRPGGRFAASSEQHNRTANYFSRPRCSMIFLDVRGAFGSLVRSIKVTLRSAPAFGIPLAYTGVESARRELPAQDVMAGVCMRASSSVEAAVLSGHVQ